MTRIALFMVFVVSLSNCDLLNNDEEPQVKTFNQKSKEVLKSTDRFGWELLKTINKETEKGENIVISSLSVLQALGMTTNGAAGTTRDQMLEVMDFGDVPTMNDAFKNIREVLHSADPKVEVEVANSVWYKQNLPAKDSFRKSVEHYYNATSRGLDFSDKEGSKNIINDWVNEKTRGKIPSIIDEIKDAQHMFLVNAVYFLGKWKYQFDKSVTRDSPFHLSDATQLEVPMMNQESDLDYFEGEECRAVKLPYGNGSFYMIIALPNTENGVEQLINNMSTEKWNTVLAGMNEQTLALYMPRFELECKYELNGTLQKMGMELPFAPNGADFSNMIDVQVFIDEVMHKTYIKADEEGTEAAAATSVGISVTSVGAGPISFRVDRPFLFAIAEEESGAILFSGKIENPEQ
jgi:serpin B